MRNLIGFFLIFCIWLSSTLGQVPNNTTNPQKTETVNGIVKVDTRPIENLPIGKEIIAELQKLKYVSRERISGDDWHLQLNANLAKTVIEVERFGYGFLQSFPIAQKADSINKILEIVKREASWQAVKFLGNKNSNSKVKIDVRVIPIKEVDFESGKVTEDYSESRRKQIEREGFKENDFYSLEVTNSGSEPVYINALYLKPTGEIASLYSPKVIADAMLPRGKMSLSRSIVLRVSKPFGIDTLKVIATKGFVDLGRVIDSSMSMKSRFVENEFSEYIANLPDSSVSADLPAGDWATAQTSFQAGEQKTLHVLSVGINKYQDKDIINLRGAENDARDFSASLKEYGRGTFDRVRTRVLLTEETTKAEIIASFREFAESVKPQDTFIFQFSGVIQKHIEPNSSIEEAFFITYDTDSKNLQKNAISTFELQTMLSQIQAHKQFLILDGCFSTSGFNRFISKLERENREYAGLIERDTWILGADANSLVAEKPVFEEGAKIPSKYNGRMTYYLLEGINGKADLDNDGYITVKELTNYPHKFVEDESNGSQKLKVWSFGKDFVIAKTKLKTEQSKNITQSPQFITASFQQTQDDKDKQTVRSGVYSVDGKSPTERRGKDFALLIATDKYSEGWDELKNPINDAETIAKELGDFYGFEVEILRNPKRADILAALKRAKARQYQPDDQLFIFFAGHGHFAEQPVKEGYIVAADTKKPAEDEWFDTYLKYSLLRQVLDQLDCKHVFLMIDACYGGTFDEEVAMRGPNDNDKPKYEDATNMEFVWRRMQFRTRRYLTSGGKEYVPDGRPGFHSPFASRFIEALRDYGGRSGILTINGILSYVERVKPTPFEGRWGTHEPGGDFLFIVKKK